MNHHNFCFLVINSQNKLKQNANYFKYNKTKPMAAFVDVFAYC